MRLRKEQNSYVCTIVPRAASHKNLSAFGWRVGSVDYIILPLPGVPTSGHKSVIDQFFFTAG